ncbi:hypothetical protein GF389_00195, partial [Candidatus Dojkabacteria bacterium]|nr:hypothetical protein [Candidatus Dojkabacteria bacterium]
MLAQNNPYAVWVEFNPEHYARDPHLVQTLLLLVTNKNPVAINLTGPRWVGKSATLKFLKHVISRLQEQEHKNQEQKYEEYRQSISDLFRAEDIIVLCLDLGDLSSSEEVLSVLVEELYSRLVKPDQLLEENLLKNIRWEIASEDSTAEGKREQIQILSNEAAKMNKRVILCLDHASESNFLEDKDNIQMLGSLVKWISLILASRRTLVDDFPLISASPLHNVLIYEQMGLLTFNEAERLLSLSTAEEELALSDKDKTLLIKHVGRHPYLLVRAARQAFAHLLSGSGQGKITESIIQHEIDPALHVVFERLWQEYKEQLLEFYKHHKQEKPNDISQETLFQLKRDALIFSDTGKNKEKLFSPLFESFIERKIEKEKALRIHELDSTVFSDDVSRVLSDLPLKPGTNEYVIMRLLLENSGQVVKDEEILSVVWEGNGTKHLLDTTVARVRTKLKEVDAPGEILRHRNK